jgi:WD40 repeat protein
VDRLALGGEQHKVDTHLVASPEVVSLADPYLAMTFSSPIQRVQWVGRYVLGYPESDSEVQLFDTESERVRRFRTEVSVKSGALDPLGKYFACTTCDGFLSIFSLPEEGSSGELVKRVKVSKLNVKPFGENPFEVSWAPDGSSILTSGDVTLGSVARDTWELTYQKEFMHKKAISCIAWLSDTVLATAGLDKMIKVWSFTKKQLLYFITSPNEITQVSYCQRVIQPFILIYLE